MSNEKKFLDSSGIGHLWDRIEERYPNMDELGLIIDAIDEVKADKTDIVQADWNQNDETALDYVKNRTHWVERGKIELLPETSVTVSGGSAKLPSAILQVGELYTVTFNGTVYDCVAWSNGNIILIGNGSIYGGNDVSTGSIGGNGEPFVFENYIDGRFYLNTDTNETYVISISTIGDVFHKLNEKYLPNGNILNGSTIGSIRSVGSKAENDEYVMGNYSYAEGYNTKASGTYSHAEGSSTTASGSNSHAEGQDTTASGVYSHAEGQDTTASGTYSHAEGSSTTASGSYSHAEGYDTTASGSNSHAEGDQTIASGMRSHAEGYYTLASGHRAHAENYRTIAYGSDSHAEGIYTLASGNNSHAEGYGNRGSISLVGEANTTTYIANSWDDRITKGIIVECNGKYAQIVSYSKANSTITLDQTLSNKALDGYYVSVYWTGAFGQQAHTEGYSTTASASNSHAEGYETIASGSNSHAEGYYATASSDSAHAEGYYTTASAPSAHAEGQYTAATWPSSHAEGYYTTASSYYQHVQGKYNIEDSSNTYAHIVGNGTSSASSNAHTLDWNGNAWFQGTIKLGGTSQDDENAVEVATKTDLDSYEFITVADIDEICNAVTEGSLESTDVDELMNKLQ